MKNKIKKIAIKIFNFLNALFFLKNKKKIIFYCAFGYEDNARSFYEYLTANKYDLKFVWAFNKNAFEKIPHCKCIKYPSLRCVFNYFTAKYIFTTHSFYGRNFNNRKQIVIYSIHGMPFKGLNVDEKIATLHPKNYYCIATSKAFSKQLQDAIGVVEENILETGMPRNDELFKNTNILSELKIDKYNKTIIWMPTFRRSKTIIENSKNTDFGIPIINECDLEELDFLLKKYNYLLILKLHPWALEQMCDLSKYQNIISIKNSDLKGYALYNLLGKIDALITDFSSVCIDYILLNKPICYAFDDLKEYSSSRNFAFTPIEDYMYGPIVQTKKELFDFIKCLETNNINSKKRKMILNYWHKHCDCNSSERIASLFFKH